MGNNSKTPVRRISLEEVQNRKKDVIFVDARSATALSRNPLQVPGAIHVPMKALDQGLKRLPKNRTLVTYCT